MGALNVTDEGRQIMKTMVIKKKTLVKFGGKKQKLSHCTYVCQTWKKCFKLVM